MDDFDSCVIIFRRIFSLEANNKGISKVNTDAWNEVNTLWFAIIARLRTFLEEKKDFQIANLYNDDYGYYSEYRWKPKEYYKKWEH